MSDKKSNGAVSGGIGLGGATFIAFLVLKLCGVIDWSWWWITAPLWGGFAVGIIIAIILFIWFVIVETTKDERDKLSDALDDYAKKVQEK
jgi:Flp pilus assembly protein TadB